MSLKMARYCHRLGNLGVLSKWGSFRMFKIELCYFFIIFVMPAGLYAWMMQIGIMIPLYFHLAVYTQIALRSNATVTLREQKVQMSAFSLTKKCHGLFPLARFSLFFFFKECFALVSRWRLSGSRSRIWKDMKFWRGASILWLQRHLLESHKAITGATCLLLMQIREQDC